MKNLLIILSLSLTVITGYKTNAVNKIQPETNVVVKDKSKPKSNIESKSNADLKKKAKSKGDIKAKNTDSIEYSKIITVHGMVCAFCSNSLQKKLKEEKVIDQVKVDLTNKKVSVLFKKGKSIEDEKLKKIITSAGFKVIKIEPSSGSG